jgi:hypothetical protein
VLLHACNKARVTLLKSHACQSFRLVYWNRNDEQEMQRETSILTQRKSRLLIERVGYQLKKINEKLTRLSSVTHCRQSLFLLPARSRG